MINIFPYSQILHFVIFSVHEDPDFSISIFIMNGKARIPLHNHPDMHGLLQVRKTQCLS